MYKFLVNIVRNILKRGAKDITDKKRIMMYLDGENIKEEGLLLREDQILPYSEQLVKRVNHPICSQCVKQGSCSHCGCSLPIAMYVPEFECSEGHFGAMDLPK